jgi:hypothetical protein
MQAKWAKGKEQLAIGSAKADAGASAKGQEQGSIRKEQGTP